MGETQNEKEKTMTNNKATAAVVGTPNIDNTDRFNVITAIKGLIQMGRTYTQARDCAIAHVLGTEYMDGKIKRGVAAKLATDTGLNKSDVSRIARIVIDNSKARKAALAVDVLTIQESPETLNKAAKVGALFMRTDKKPTAPKVTTPSGEKGEETTNSGTVTTKPVSDDVDVTALVDQWLRSATESQFAARMALLENLLATIAAERATSEESEADAA